MSKYPFLTFLVFSITSFFALQNCTQNNSVKVKIKVTSDKLDSTTNLFITGNMPELGYWKPDIVQLENENLGWAKTFEFEKDSDIEFKFTKGTWETEALDNNGNVLRNFYLEVNNDTTLYFDINKWKDQKDNQNISHQITGEVKYHKQFSSDKLLPRDIIVWLPPDYSNNKGKRYPVLYMHDGQNIFDPSTSFNGIDWQMDEAADSLIRKNEIEPLIIVGIYNTANRTKEYTPGKTNRLYTNFLVNKLKPFIDSTYRTEPDRNNTFVGGSSYGGTISIILLWEYSNVFSKAACFSPAFKTTKYNYINFVNRNNVKNNVQLYIDNGGLGVDIELQSGVDSMITVLKNKGYKEGTDFLYIFDSNAEHNEESWAKRVPFMLKFFLGK